MNNTLGADITINSLNFTSTSSTVTIGAGNTLTINPLGTTPNGITVASGSAAQFVNVAVALGRDQTWTNNSSNLLTVGGNVANGGFTLTTAGAGDITMSGAITGAGGLTKSGNGTLTLSGLSATAASNYSGTTSLNGGITTITSSVAFTGGLTFGAAAASTSVSALDLSTVSATFGGATVVQTNSASANTISIGSGQTLRLNGSVTVGYNSSANTTTRLTVSGLGTLTIGAAGAATNAGVTIGGSITSAVSNAATLDMSGLSTFYANLGTGTFRVGDSTNSGGGAAAGSTLILAANSTIIATILTSDSPGDDVTQVIKLGSGTNVFNANTINIGAAGTSGGPRSDGTLDFITGLSGTGDLTIRGLAGGMTRATMNVVAGAATTASSFTGTVNLGGHYADLMLSTLSIAARSATSGTGSATGTFTFDTGILDATTVVLGSRTAPLATSANLIGTLNLMASGGTGEVTIGTLNMAINSGSFATTNGFAMATVNIGGSGTVDITTMTMANNSIGGGATDQTQNPAQSTVNISGSTTTIGTLNMNLNSSANTGAGNASVSTLNISAGSVTIGAGGINMANASDASATANSTIMLTGGTLTLGGDLTRANGVGVENTTLTLDGSTAVLDMGGFSIGSASSVIGSGTGSLSFITGTLQNVAEINGGAGLTKTTAGTLILEGNNAYTGQTLVTQGAVTVNSNTGLGAATGTAGTSTTVSTGAALQLQNNITIGNEALTLNSDGISSGGALRNLTGNNTYGGAITLATASRINSDADKLTLDVSTGNTITGSNLDVTFGGAGNIDVKDAISLGSGALNKDGAGILTLTANNAYSGATSISGGTLSVSASAHLGDGSATNDINLSNNGTLQATASFSTGASREVNIGTGGGTVQTVGSSTTVTINSVVTGSATLTKTGVGTLELTTDSSAFSGLFNVKEGVVSTSNDAAAKLGGSMVVGVLPADIARLDPGSVGAGTVGTLTFIGAGSNLTLSGSSSSTVEETIRLVLDLGAAGTAADYNDAANLRAAILGSPGFTTLADYLALNSTKNSYESTNLGVHDKVQNITSSVNSGTLFLNATGRIQVTNVNAASFGFGDIFDLLDWGTINAGSFSAGAVNRAGNDSFEGSDLYLPSLSGDLLWDTTLFTTNGILVVVPEPSRMLLLLLGLALALFRRRRPTLYSA